MENDDRWVLEVNDEVISAHDLEQATRLFLAKYDASLISLSRGSSGQRTDEETAGFEIADNGQLAGVPW